MNAVKQLFIHLFVIRKWILLSLFATFFLSCTTSGHEGRCNHPVASPQRIIIFSANSLDAEKGGIRSSSCACNDGEVLFTKTAKTNFFVT
jgi:hypothetical protein